MNDELIKDAELRKIKAETEKLKSEKRKLDLQRRFNLWEVIFKIIAIVVVPAALYIFFVDRVIIPSTQAENIRLSLDIQKARIENKEVLDSTKKTLDSIKQVQGNLSKLNQDLKINLNVVKNENEKVIFQLKNVLKHNSSLSKKYQELSSSHLLTQTERDEFKNKYNIMKEDGIRLQKGINELTSRIELAGWEEGRLIAAHRFFGFYPNPFTDTTRLLYSLPQSASVTIAIFDSLKTKLIKYFFINDIQGDGERQIEWDARDDQGKIIPNGKYICKVRLGPNEWEEIVVVKKGN
jgi:hypothetical protein